MNDREKKLLTFLVIAVLAGVLLTGTKSYLTYLDNLRSDLNAANQDRTTYENQELAANVYEGLIDEYELMSLGSDHNHALASYKAWLINLLENDLQLQDVRITNEPTRAVDGQYHRHLSLIHI